MIIQENRIKKSKIMCRILIYYFKVDSRSQNKKVGKTSIENMKILVETLVETKLKQR